MMDMDKYKKKVKENIEKLINNNNLEDAKSIIKEYEELVEDDIEIYSFKGIIAMMEGNMEEAEITLKRGLLLDEENFDLLYNLAYFYRLEGNSIKAYEFYKKSNKYAKNIDLKKQIEKIIKEYLELDQIKKYNEMIRKQNLKYPKVTIIIPAYNQRCHLKQAIDSCLEQDYTNLEILVGDDCSTDGTDKMMKEYEKYKKIIYIRNKRNLGAGNNSKYLLDNYVSSKYGMILNHDDYLIKKDYISKAVKLLMKNPNLSFVWANCKIKDEILNKNSFTNIGNKKIMKGIDYFLNYETSKYPHITGVLTTVFDMEKLSYTGYGNEKTKSKDVFLYLKLMLVGDIGFINECVSVYRVHKGGISFNMPLEYDKSTIKEFEKLQNYVLDKNIANEKQMEIWINNRVIQYVYWRFCTLWNNRDRKEAINLLISISKKYPYAYEKILDQI